MRSISRLRAAGLTAAIGAVGVLTSVPAASATSTPISSGVVANVFVNIGVGDQPSIDVTRSWYQKYGPPDGSFPVVARTGLGTYRITLEHVRARYAMVNLTMVNVPGEAGNDPICAVRTVSVASSRTRVTVNCFDPVTGKRAPGSHFVLHVSNANYWSPDPVANRLHFRTDSSTSTHSPAVRFRTDGPEKIKVVHYKTGVYHVVVSGARWDVADGTVVTTAISSSARWCNPVSWSPYGATGDDLFIEVDCFKPGGLPANSRFALIAARHSQFDAPWLPAAAQAASVGSGNGPTTQFGWGFNSANNNNVAAYDTPHEVTVLWEPGVAPAPSASERSIFVSAVGAQRCAISWAPIAFLIRFAAVRCHDILGYPLKAPVSVMDSDMDGCLLC